jgi:hypothetical protein
MVNSSSRKIGKNRAVSLGLLGSMGLLLCFSFHYIPEGGNILAYSRRKIAVSCGKVTGVRAGKTIKAN